MEIPVWLPISVIIVGMFCKIVALYQYLINKNASRGWVWLGVGLTCTVIGFIMIISMYL